MNSTDSPNSDAGDILALLDVGICVLDVTGVICRTEGNIAALSGRTDDNLAGMALSAIIHVGDHARLDIILRRAAEDGLSRGMLRLVQPDGTLCTVQASIRATEHKQYVVALTDISQISRTVDDLRQNERRYRYLAENAIDIIFLLDREGNFVDVNETFLKYWQTTREKVFGCHYRQIIHDEDHSLADYTFSQALAGGSSEAEIRTIGRDAPPSWFSFIARPIYGEDDAVSAIHVSARNINERKKTEEALCKSEARLRQAEKMEAIGTLAGGIAHDFNNILAAIMGQTEMAFLELQDAERLGHRLEEILGATHRARDLVRQILTFSRQQEEELHPVQVAPIIKESLKLLRASLPANIEIRQNIPERPAAVMGNPTQIQQVLMNLCTNAHHAMWDQGGILEVAIDEVTLTEEKLIHYPDLEPGSYLRLAVSDTGCGIPAAIMERIFDPFFTTKGPSRGTGMGLAVVHGIATGLGGTIAVQSAPGMGTTVEVLLPVAEAEEKPQQETRQPSRGNGERILIVDDEVKLVELVQEMLSMLGYEVRSSSRPDEALQLFARDPQGYDLIISDMSMPVMTGLDLTREVLRIRPGMPIILCSGYSDLIAEEQARESGVSAFLSKPVVMSDLSRTIRQALS